MIDVDAAETIADGEDLSNEIKPLLVGQSPEVVGMALADLAAILFAGHNPAIRKEALERWFSMVRDLTAFEVDELIKSGRVGPEWREERRQ